VGKKITGFSQSALAGFLLSRRQPAILFSEPHRFVLVGVKGRLLIDK
jgi:hypothetical protein